MIARWTRLGPLVSVLVVASLTAVGWMMRESLHVWMEVHQATLPSVVVGLTMWLLAASSVLGLERRWRARQWLDRNEALTGLQNLGSETALERLKDRVPDPLEWLVSPLRRRAFGKTLLEDWRDAGLGSKLSRYLLLLAATAGVGAVIGSRIAGPLLAVGMAVIVPWVPLRIVAGRAEDRRKRFGDQVPAALDAIAAGLAAGLSFPSAVKFSAEELPAPIRNAMRSLHLRMELGHSVEDSLSWLLDRHPGEEGLNLAIDGVILQRRLGGDLVRMLEETASVVRERVELEQEVRAVTAQGRLSGWVIGGLVPVSAVLLLVSNPRYINVLFETIPGQALLILALLLQLTGWVVISRLVRVEY